MLDVRRPVAAHRDHDHVESHRPVVRCGMSKKILCRSDDLLLLIGVNGIGPVERLVVASAGFDLDEHEGRALGGDQVDLSQVAAVVAGDESIPAPPQVPRRDTLTERAQRDPITRRRQPPRREAT